ncbi:hypothetical protein [Streptomyces sp. NPDC090021]|uniref:hypothetical protein n=1 Tax=Streptomyces sp. NPDC090021 TaxID=3365919 RepID=UPI00381E5098
MEEFLANVPWGILRLEPVDGVADIPDADPDGQPVSANEACVTITVLHGDFGEVCVRIGNDVTVEGEQPSFTGVIECPSRVLVLSDIVGEMSYLRFPVGADNVEIAVWLDKPVMAEEVTIRVREL